MFVFDQNVSLEFTKGIGLVDPNQVLKGTSKVRRRIKLLRLGDIVGKDCQTVFAQALMDLI